MDHTTLSGDALARRLYDLISLRPLTVTPLHIPLARLTENRPYANVYELLADPCVCPAVDLHRLEASSAISNTMSDYERFAAVCEAMPRWAGHPLYAAIHGILEKVLDCRLPLNQGNTPHIWRICAQKLMAKDIGIRDVLLRMGVGTAYTPLYSCDLSDETLAQQPIVRGMEIRPILDAGVLIDANDPLYIHGWETIPLNLSAYTTALTAALDRFAATGGKEIRVSLPPSFAFVRPDPYHAGLAWQKVPDQQELSVEDANLLTVQTLRIWGQACVELDLSLTICHGLPDEVANLLLYLKGCNGLPSVTYIPDGLSDVDNREVFLTSTEGISLGMALSGHDTVENIRQKLTAYAARFPLGCLPRMELPVRHATDLWTLREARRTLCDLLAQWADHGYAPKDLPTLTELAKII